MAGHFYYWKIKKYFDWGGQNTDVQACATQKTAGQKHKAEMQRYDVGLPMKEVAIDLMGPFLKSEDGNKYVLVLVDSFSKWMEAHAVPNIESKTIAEKLVMEFISHFRIQVQIKSDRGKQSDCELLRNRCQLRVVDHEIYTAFHPLGNSRVENMVKVVGNLKAVFCRRYREFDKNLPLLILAYQSAVHEVMGFPSNFIMTGWEIALPFDIMLGTLQDGEKDHSTRVHTETTVKIRDMF